MVNHYQRRLADYQVAGSFGPWLLVLSSHGKNIDIRAIGLVYLATLDELESHILNGLVEIDEESIYTLLATVSQTRWFRLTCEVSWTALL